MYDIMKMQGLVYYIKNAISYFRKEFNPLWQYVVATPENAAAVSILAVRFISSLAKRDFTATKFWFCSFFCRPQKEPSGSINGLLFKI